MQKNAEKKDQKNVELIPFLESNQNKLVKFDELKAKQEQLVKENPYVEITDAKSYEEAKKARTNLKTGRTEIQNGDKKIASFFTKFRKALKGKAEELILITQAAEDKQQEEVTRWENIKKEEKEKKDKAEELRIENIKNKVTEYKENAAELINNCTFATIESTREALNKLFNEDAKEFDFAEFELLIDAEEEASNTLFDNRVSELTKAENDRLKQIEDGQKAKYNEVKLHVLETIDEATTEDLTLVENLEIYFHDLKFDFGPFEHDVIKLKEVTIEKAMKRVESLKEQAEKDKELAKLKADKEEQERKDKEQNERTEKRIKEIQEKGYTSCGSGQWGLDGYTSGLYWEFIHNKTDEEFNAYINDDLKVKAEKVKEENIEKEGKLLESHKTEVFADIQALGNHEDFTARYEEIKGNIKAFEIEGLTEDHINQNKEIFTKLNDELDGKLEAIKQQKEKEASERIERLKDDKEELKKGIESIEVYIDKTLNEFNLENDESKEFKKNLAGYMEHIISGIKKSITDY